MVVPQEGSDHPPSDGVGRSGDGIRDRVATASRWILQHRTPGGASRVYLLLLALAIFVVGGWIALRRAQVDFAELDFGALAVLAVVGVPLTIAGKALEYRLSARVVGIFPSIGESLRVSIYSTAANLLPLPGSVVVRVGALKLSGARTKTAVGTTAYVGVVWLGVASLLAGLASLGRPVVGTVLLGGGVAGLTVAGLFLRRVVAQGGLRRRLMAATIGIEAASISAAAFRIALALRALGVTGGASQGFVLALSGALASSLGVFPGGLGIRELVAAGLGPLVNVAPAAAYLAAAVDRTIGIFVHGAIALVLSVRFRSKRQVQS